MTVDRFIRVVLGVLLLLAFIVALAAVLYLTESALNVWDRLRQGPAFMLYGYVAALGLLAVAVLWLSVRLLVRRRAPSARRRRRRPLDRGEIESRLREADAAGVDTAAAQRELDELAARQAGGAVHLCVAGEISSGKSSLIRALVPAARVRVSPVGGTTVAIRHYRWQTAAGGNVLLSDVPGTGGVDGALERRARDEALRAQVVLFVCDGDLTRGEKRLLEELLALDKPLILVLNKADRYDAAEQALLMQRLLAHVDDLGGSWSRDQVVAVSAGGEVDVVERLADGSERVARRTRPADIGVLAVAINRMLEREGAALDRRRDRAVFRLAADRLEEAEAAYRTEQSEQIIRGATRKAVLGALAAVSPGTDIVIQGYIGTTMTRALCRLYGAVPRDLDIEEFLNLSQSRAGRVLPLTLAVAGNGLKAFPGLGTVAGGLVHAVAYGLIFDALGRSLVQTLERHGELKPEKAAEEFEDSIGEHIEAGVQQVAGMALAESRRREEAE